MIPKLIWQTYKAKIPPKEAIESIKTWITKNNTYSWYYMDDYACQKFITEHFSDEFVDMYKSLPYGVMKSDAWRIAVIYVYGGVYADLDTECVVPIDLWSKDKDLIVSYEPPTVDGIVNFVFASAPQHPALLNCLEQLLINYNGPNYLDKLNPTGMPVQNYGQHAFYAGIKKYIQNNPNDDKVKIFSLEENAFTPYKDHRTLVHHKTGSMFWGNNYDSWRRKQVQDFGY
jgi:mannosyltransferase OCH1-like enzyme